MDETRTQKINWAKKIKIHMSILDLSIGIGTFLAVKSQVGFWWALLYGIFWEGWFAYRLAEYLITQ